MRVAIAGAGVGGLALGVRLADAGHDVTIFEQNAWAGGKCARVERDGFVWDAGPSLLTLPELVRELVPDLELLPVEPVTHYAFADGTTLDLWSDTERSAEAIEAWSPGSGAQWRAFMGECARMWEASQAFLTGPPPLPPRRAGPADPRDLLRVKPWWTLHGLARARFRDARLRMVVERFATYAGADPRRAPAALATAGYVEHAFGAWHPRGGMYAIVEGLVRRFSGDLRLSTPVHALGSQHVETDAGVARFDAVVSNIDAERTATLAGHRWRRAPSRRSLSGLALLLGLRDRPPAQDPPHAPFLHHHTIRFPANYDAEFDDVFAGRAARDPTIYVCAPGATEPEQRTTAFVLVNAPARTTGVDWDAEADRIVDRLGMREHVETIVVRSPADLERETGAVAGAIYGVAPHGRLGALRRPGVRIGGVWLVGGSAHPGGGLPLVLLGARTVARDLAGA